MAAHHGLVEGGEPTTSIDCQTAPRGQGVVGDGERNP